MNNKEKNTYSKQKITEATILLLNENELTNISISQITTTACVSRNSFYRNYSDKEDILSQYCYLLLDEWNTGYQKHTKDSNAELYGSLFKHLKDHSDFYCLLKQRNLFYLFLNALLKFSGPKPDYVNMWAYTTAFITYGTYGWIEEWIGRGMQESAEEMAVLLTTHGMK